MQERGNTSAALSAAHFGFSRHLHMEKDFDEIIRMVSCANPMVITKL